MKRLTVIVPIYNALDDVKICLKSLLENFNFDLGTVFLINDYSDDITSEFLEDFCLKNKGFKLISNEENLGFVKTCNKGMNLAQTEFLVLLNSDTAVPTGFAECIIKCFESNEKIGLASPISSNSNSYYIYMRDGYTVEEMNKKIRSKHESVYPLLPEAEGFCFCIRKKVIEQQGFLDEIYGKGYHEEVDFSYRAITNGWKIVLIDDLYVYHKRQASFGGSERDKLLSQNNEVFYSRWEGFRQKYKEDNNLVNPVIAIEEKVFKADEKKKNFKLTPIKNKMLAHLHLYYHDQLDFMIKKMKNINNCDWDLYVTVCEENPVSTRKILSFKKDAKIIKVENRGYDIWPFIQILRMVDIDDYDVVLKIHTKNYRKESLNFIGKAFKGFFWRDSLINALIGSKKEFFNNLQKFYQTNTGMIFDEKFMLPLLKNRQEDTTLLEDLKQRLNIVSDYNYFCAGTMFMIRASVLKQIITSNIDKKDFEKNGYTSENGKLVHSLERIFSILTKAQGYDVFVNKNIKKYSQKYKPKFSIILPTYNRASFIKDAIDSLLLQSYENYELIIVDDGSTDNSEKLIKTSYSKEIKQKKIKYIKLKTNTGVSNARNIGLKKAKNEWIAYLDSDNKIKNNFLDEFSKAIIQNKNNKIFYAKLQRMQDKVIVGEPFQYLALLIENYIDLGCFVHHRSLVKKYGNFDINLRRLVDWDLIIRYTKNNRPVFIDKVLLDYNSGNYDRITLTEAIESAKKEIRRKIFQSDVKKYTKIIKKYIGNKNTAFWGASIFLEYLLSYKNDFKNVVGIIDKSPEQQGKNISGYMIFSPEDLKDIKVDNIIMTIQNNNRIIYPKIKEYIEKNHPSIKLMPNIFE